MRPRFALVLTTAILTTLLPAREANFYLPDDEIEEKTEKQKEAEHTANTESSDKSQKSEDSDEPTKKVDSEKREPVNLRVRQNTPDEFDPPLDPYGMAQAFQHRWDFSSFLITAKEELKFRLDAARSRTLRLARAFSALSAEVEERQRNLNSAALAAYLLSRDQHSWNPIEGRNLTEAQMLAVRSTMQQDIAAMHLALTDYEILRSSLNKSAEDVAAMEENGLDAVAPLPAPAIDRPTLPTAMLAHSRTNAVLRERLVSVEALKATLAAEALSHMGDLRQSIASFAPPPPLGIERQQSSGLPTVPSDEVMKNQPRGEQMKQPEKAAVVFPTDINAPVHAVKQGVVAYTGPVRGYGDMVIIEHEKGLFSIYSHLGSIQVRERQAIASGAILGRAGNLPELGRSGIHFQARKDEAPLKAEEWLGKGRVKKLLTR